MTGTDTAGMVPAKYDVIVDGHGYILWRQLMQSLPFRNQRAAYSYSPTFVQRQNVSGDYGDNQQDFWLTFNQNDWSLGDEQRYYRPNGGGGETSKRKYWAGTSVDITIPGQVSMRPAVASATFAAAVGPAVGWGVTSALAAGTTKLYLIDSGGGLTDEGAHGLGTTPLSIVSDRSAAYFTSEAGGTVGVRAWNGAAYSTFSATPVHALAFNTNVLYGLKLSGGLELGNFSTGGVYSMLFQWKNAAGSLIGSTDASLAAFGGSILVLLQDAPSTLWIYDGTSTSQVAAFPANFYASGMAVSFGTVLIAGMLVVKDTGTSRTVRPAVLYYLNGQYGTLWKSATTLTTSGALAGLGPAITPYGDGVVWTDDSTGYFVFYDPDTGGTHTLGAYTVAGSSPVLAATQRFFLHTRTQTGAYFFPDTSTTASSATVQTSLYDFDSSLSKLFRGIIVEFDSASDGDGGTVDVAYRIANLNGSYTTLQTTAVSGTEYLLSGVTGRSLSVKVTLNKSTSTSGPVLKRIYVRASPVQQSFRRCQYVLDLTGVTVGTAGANLVRLQDGTDTILTGSQLAANLVAAIESTAPISVTDRFGTYTGVFEQGEGITELDEVRPGEFVAQVTLREV